MWWALIWNNIESYDYNNYDDNKDFDGYEGYEGFDDFDDIINQEGGIQIYMFEPFAWDCGKNGCRIYWSLTCHKIYYVFLGVSSKKYLQGWTCKKIFLSYCLAFSGKRVGNFGCLKKKAFMMIFYVVTWIW